MELRYWKGDSKLGLPSIDVTSLELLAFLKFVKANVKVNATKRSWFFSKAHHLPALETTEGDFLNTTGEIYQYLRLKFYDLDGSLPPSEQMKIPALKSLLKEKLYLAVDCFLWLDVVNYAEYSRSAYGSRCHYPLNFIVPQRKRDACANLLKEKTVYDFNSSKVPDSILNGALDVIELFEEYLSDEKKYIFGERPSSVDASLFSCLVILMKTNLPNRKLQQHIRNKHNLIRFVNTILREHFTEDISPKHKDPSDEKSHDNDGHDEKYDWVFPVAVATVAMVSYAINIGLLQIARK